MSLDNLFVEILLSRLTSGKNYGCKFNFKLCINFKVKDYTFFQKVYDVLTYN